MQHFYLVCVMTALPLTDEERKAISDAIGTVVAFFVDSNREARAERDAAIARAEEAERWLLRLQKPDGEVRETVVSRG